VTAPAVARFMRGLFPDKGAACQEELRALRALRGQQQPGASDDAAEVAQPQPLPSDGAVEQVADDGPDGHSGPTHGDLPSHRRSAHPASGEPAGPVPPVAPRRPARPGVALALVGAIAAVAMGGLAAKVWRGSRSSASGAAYAAQAPREAVGLVASLDVPTVNVRVAEVRPLAAGATRPERHAVKVPPRPPRARGHAPSRAGSPRIVAARGEPANRRARQGALLDPWPHE